MAFSRISLIYDRHRFSNLTLHKLATCRRAIRSHPRCDVGVATPPHVESTTSSFGRSMRSSFLGAPAVGDTRALHTRGRGGATPRSTVFYRVPVDNSPYSGEQTMSPKMGQTSTRATTISDTSSLLLGVIGITRMLIAI